jgi:hypothetical protein
LSCTGDQGTTCQIAPAEADCGGLGQQCCAGRECTEGQCAGANGGTCQEQQAAICGANGDVCCQDRQCVDGTCVGFGDGAECYGDCGGEGQDCCNIEANGGCGAGLDCDGNGPSAECVAN